MRYEPRRQWFDWFAFVEDVSAWKWVVVLVLIEFVRLGMDLHALAAIKHIELLVESIQIDLSNLIDALNIAHG